MKDTRSIEEQVAELTEQQKDAILKVAKYGTIILIITMCLCIVATVITFAISVVMISIVGSYVCFVSIPIFALIFLSYVVVLVAYTIFLNVKVPYYSDKKAKYLKQQKKAEKTSAK